MKVKVIDNNGKETVYDTTMDMSRALDVLPQNVSKYVISTDLHGECRRGRFRGYKFLNISE